MFQPVRDWLMIETLALAYVTPPPIRIPSLWIELMTNHPQTGSYVLKCAWFLLPSRHDILWVKANFRDTHFHFLVQIIAPTQDLYVCKIIILPLGMAFLMGPWGWLVWSVSEPTLPSFLIQILMAKDPIGHRNIHRQNVNIFILKTTWPLKKQRWRL